MGGYDRKNTFENLKKYKNKIKKVYLFGEMKNKLKEFFDEIGVPNLVCSIELSVIIFFNESSNNDVLLFSPGNPSYDEFKSFEERGVYFKNMVQKFGIKKA